MDEKELFELDDVDTFIFHREWLIDGISKLPPEIQAKIVLDGLLKGYGMEPLFENDGDYTVQAFSELFSNNVVRSREAYLNKKNYGKVNGGRKKKFSDEEIGVLKKQGKTVDEIMKILGCSESTVRHSSGYREK